MSFMRRYLPRLVPKPFASMHEEWDDIAVEDRRLDLIWAHRESAKSTIWAIGYSLWRLCLWCELRMRGTPDQDEHGVILGPTDDDAKDRVRQILHELDTNKLLRQDFNPQKGKPWSEEKFSFKGAGDVKNPTMMASGILAFNPGPRLTFFVADDIVDPKHVLPRLQRDKLHQQMTEVVLPSLLDTGKGIVIGTVYHNDDELNRLGKDPEWSSKRYPLVADEERKEVSWPEVFTWPRVERIMKKPVVYARQYQLRNLRTEELLLPEPRWYDKRIIEYRDSAWRIRGVPCLIASGVDPATTESEINDGCVTAITTIAVNRDMEKYTLECRSGRWAPDRVMAEMISCWKKWSVNEFYLEEIAFAKIFGALLRKHTALPVKASPAKGDKVQRLTGTLNPEMSNGKIFFLESGEDGQEDLTGDINEFPGQILDRIDSLEHAVRGVNSSKIFAGANPNNRLIRNMQQSIGSGSTWINQGGWRD